MMTAEISDLLMSNVFMFSSNRIEMSCHTFLLLAVYKDILLNYYPLFMHLKPMYVNVLRSTIVFLYQNS